jgi:hypothetical protein
MVVATSICAIDCASDLHRAGSRKFEPRKRVSALHLGKFQFGIPPARAARNFRRLQASETGSGPLTGPAILNPLLELLLRRRKVWWIDPAALRVKEGMQSWSRWLQVWVCVGKGCRPGETFSAEATGLRILRRWTAHQ